MKIVNSAAGVDSVDDVCTGAVRLDPEHGWREKVADLRGREPAAARTIPCALRTIATMAAPCMSKNDRKRGLQRGLTSYGDDNFRCSCARPSSRAPATPMRPSTVVVGHHRHRQRLQSLSRQHAAADGRRAARRDAGGRTAHALPDHLHPRELRAPDQHVPAQPHVHGHGGDDPRAAHGCGGADRRLRQDRPRAAHGRRVRRCSRHPAGHRRHANRCASRERVGACTDCRRYWGRFRAGEIDADEIARSTTDSWPASAPVR